MNNKRKTQSLPVADRDPKPGDFPVGSVQSRAAARTRLERAAREPKPKVQIFQNGVLQAEHECDGMEESITVNVICVGG